MAAAASTTLQAVCEDFLAREGSKLRTHGKMERTLERLVYPVLGSRQIAEVKRSEIVRLLDDIEDANGPDMAEKTGRHLTRIFNWYGGRADDFRPPVMRMNRKGGKARERTLTDDELRAVWEAAETFPAPFGPYVRFLLLTAVRRTEAAEMVRGELSNGDWIIPADRMKGNREHVVPLSPAARKVLDGMHKLGAPVFSFDGNHPLSGFSKCKRDFDAACGVTDWRLHDLRRTARSLMSRAGVAPDIAERCLAHAVGGIRGVYDRYAYHKEKKTAFEALAMLVERIVDPIENIIELSASSQR